LEDKVASTKTITLVALTSATCSQGKKVHLLILQLSHLQLNNRALTAGEVATLASPPNPNALPGTAFN